MHILQGRKNLEVFRLSLACEKKRINEVLEIVGLFDERNKLVKSYSLGMKQRLALALAILHDPELLILDEPTNGLDPQGIYEIRMLIRMLHEKLNKTILISSHLLSEVEKIATHFGIIKKGRLLFQGTTQELHGMKQGGATLCVAQEDMERTRILLQEKFQIRIRDESTLKIEMANKHQIPGLIELLVDNKIRIYGIDFLQDSLEEQFLKIIA